LRQPILYTDPLHVTYPPVFILLAIS